MNTVYVPILLILLVLLYIVWPQKDDRTYSVDLDGKHLRIRVARQFLRRSVGLLNHSSLEAHSGLLLLGVRNVHTFGMAFDIDVVFLDGSNTVLAIERCVPAGKMVRGPGRARHTLEMAAHAAETFSLKVGDRLPLSK